MPTVEWSARVRSLVERPRDEGEREQLARERSPLATRWKPLAASLALLGASCANMTDDETSVGNTDSALIKDGAHNAGQPGFLFLPPVVSGYPQATDAFEPRLSPEVRIDELDAQGATKRTLVRYTSDHRVQDEKVRRNIFGQYYLVRFKSSRFSIDPAVTYRIRVSVGGRELGVADLDVVTSWSGLANVDRTRYVPLLKGATLPIKFRIEKKAVDRDGDGVFDWLDNCPDVKNPPVWSRTDAYPTNRPFPSGCDPDEADCDPDEHDCNLGRFQQPDSDHDGIGDACDCPAGQVQTPTGCQTQDACASTPHACDPLTTCTNTAGGGYTCSACPSGYGGDGKAGCTDIDECTAGTDDCSDLSLCMNTVGSYSCGACPAGYQGNGHSCTDIDECADHTAQCAAYATCINVPGSYRC